MELSIIDFLGLNLNRIKQFFDVICSECRFTQNTHDFNDGPSDFKIMFDDANEAICDDSHMDLYPDGIFGFSPKSLDLKMLFDPLEQFNLPPVPIKQRNICCLEIEVVRIVSKAAMKVWSIVDNPSDNGIESSMQFKFLGNTLRLGNRHHVEGKFLKDVMISEIVCFGKHLTINWHPTESEKNRFSTMCNSYICKFPETFTADELTEHKNQHVVPVGHTPIIGSIIIFGNNPSELSLGEELYYLRKNESTYMHICSDFESDAKLLISKPGQHIIELSCCA